MPTKIAKQFRLHNIGDDDLVYHGPVVLDAQFLYLVHNSHSLGSADQRFAMFGLFGFLLHYLDSSATEVPYPYKATPYAQLETQLQQTRDLGKVKKTALVMQIPREEINGYTRGTSDYTRLLCSRGPITLYGEATNIETILHNHGIPESAD